MSDDPAKIFLADTAITAGERGPESTRRFFRRKKKKAEPPPLTHCENCGTLLTGHFCGKCGQPAVDYRRSFRHVIVDVLDSFLNWDSKFLASLVHLVVRPWKLTNEFLAGHRVRYLNPLRLYLLASVLFFFMANYGERQLEKSGHLIQFDHDDEIPFGQVHEPKPGATPPIDRPGDADADVGNDTEHSPFLVGIDKSRTPTVFEAWMQQKIEEKIGKNGSKATFFLHSLMENLPYMMLVCIPLFAFVLKVLYFFRRVFYIDHLIYALHIHSFAYVMTLIITGVGLGLNQVLPELRPLAVGLLIATAFIQILISIRKVYRQGWLMTFFKFFAGGIVYFIVLLIAFGVTVFVTIAMP